ncbi:serine hydrolase domain-containing protein [Actinoplanes sp. NPDC051470]|uniref:serine hydrolase domain-containing protein n=1 Tax=Actinoplanes sp. NPDC051470 TaxID=3157224 RepID=UPI003424D91F
MRILLSLVGVLALLPVPGNSAPANNEPGLAYVVTKGDGVVRVVGEGRDSNGDPVGPDTPMRVASVSKSFTAAAVLTLVDEGRVALDRPVASYLPEFRMADPRAASITVRQLLNQTSGLSDRTVDIDATQEAPDLAGYVAALRTGRLARTPGTDGEYCNVNYDVAARLVEVVDGRPFAEAMRGRIFGPLGMTRSKVGDTPANGYNSVFGVWVERRELPAFRGGAGGVVTTAADMGRWLISQTGHGPRIVSAAGLREMHTPGPAAGTYAMGWGVEHADGRTLLVHSGNLFTYTAVEAIDPATGEGWAVMTNSASPVDRTYDQLLALAGGREPELNWRPGTLETALGVIALLALGLGVLGVLRARRWRGRTWRLVPLLVPTVVLATCPLWMSVLIGRTVTWAQMTYFPVPLTITLAVAALAGLATAAARVLVRRSVGSAR